MALELVARLHGDLFRSLTDAYGDAEGLSVVARRGRKLGCISNATLKKIVRIDDAFAVMRHANAARAAKLLTLVQSEIEQAASAKEMPPAAVPDRFVSTELESVTTAAINEESSAMEVTVDEPVDARGALAEGFSTPDGDEDDALDECDFTVLLKSKAVQGALGTIRGKGFKEQSVPKERSSKGYNNMKHMDVTAPLDVTESSFKFKSFYGRERFFRSGHGNGRSRRDAPDPVSLPPASAFKFSEVDPVEFCSSSEFLPSVWGPPRQT